MCAEWISGQMVIKVMQWTTISELILSVLDVAESVMIQHASNLFPLSSNIKSRTPRVIETTETGQISKHIWNQGRDDTCGITNQGLFNMSSHQTEMTIRTS
jgi:hypothetical protein